MNTHFTYDMISEFTFGTCCAAQNDAKSAEY